ncbi:MAG: hypothetical protein HHAS10_05790 [Candidatus Altimarinota bacterium]
MLKSPDGVAVLRNRPLSPRLLQMLKSLFANQIMTLGIIHKNTRGVDSRWLYAQPNFTHEQMVQIDRVLAKVGLRLAKRYANVNSLICYRRVDAHDDTEIPVGFTKMRIDDCSFVFVPLYGHEGGVFVIGEGNDKKKYPIQDGSVVLLDHNVEHEVQFPLGKDHLKFGLSFLVDRIIQSPPSVLSHPQGQQSPSLQVYPPHELRDHTQALSDVEA